MKRTRKAELSCPKCGDRFQNYTSIEVHSCGSILELHTYCSECDLFFKYTIDSL